MEIASACEPLRLVGGYSDTGSDHLTRAAPAPATSSHANRTLSRRPRLQKGSPEWLRFSVIPWTQRLRFGVHVLRSRYRSQWRRLDQIPPSLGSSRTSGSTHTT